jgi:hypothetical protein
MTVLATPQAGPVLHEPWFGRHPSLALGVAGLMYVAVFSLRLLTGNPADAYALLYALPVALVAVTSGLRAGTGAGLLAVALLAVWAVVRDVSLTPAGWASRVLPLLLLGVLLGHATDRVQKAQLEQRRLHEAAMLHREAIEINDTLLQGMAAAKWSLEAGRLDSGKAILDETIEEAQQLVSGLIRRADMAGRTERLRRSR